MRDAQQRLDHARQTLRRCLGHKIDNYRRGLAHIAAALQARSPARELTLRRNRIIDVRRRLLDLPARVLQHAQHRFHEMEALLRVLGPDATLRRGYSISTTAAGKLLRSVSEVRPRMKFRTRLADGEFESTVVGD